MHRTGKITYKIYSFEKVKNKVPFFGKEVYPLFIRVTQGMATANFKSHLFDVVLQPKFQVSPGSSYEADAVMAELVNAEDEIVRDIISRCACPFSVVDFRNEYILLSREILGEIDEGFKKFLIVFLDSAGLHSFAYLVKHFLHNLSSDVILRDLQTSLKPSLFDELNFKAVEYAPPYIPIFNFCKMARQGHLPLFTVFNWQEPGTRKGFESFLEQAYPQYATKDPAAYIDALISKFKRC